MSRMTTPVRLFPLGLAFLTAGCMREQLICPEPRPSAPVVLQPAAPPPPPAPQAVRPAPLAVRTVELGHSVNGTPLTMQVFGDGPEVLFIFGGIHGSEPTSAALARRFADYLHRHPELCAGRTLAIYAAANPDGLARGTYGNARHVNLNRNFPAGNWTLAGQGRRGSLSNGGHPASEPETQALLRAMKMLRPERIVSIHSIQRGRHCNNYDGPARELAERMARHNGYPVKASIGYPTPGSFGSWAGRDQGIPTITLELPRDADAETCWRENRDALIAFVETARAGPPAQLGK